MTQAQVDLKSLTDKQLISLAIENDQFPMTPTARHTLIRKLNNKNIGIQQVQISSGVQAGVNFSGFAATVFFKSQLSQSKNKIEQLNFF